MRGPLGAVIGKYTSSDNMTAEIKGRKSKKRRKYSLSISSVGSNQYPYQEMSSSEQNSNGDVKQYVCLLYEIVVSKSYKDIGSKFDPSFWEGFKDEFNTRNGKNFTYDKIVHLGRQIRERWKAHRQTQQDESNFFSSGTKKKLLKIFPSNGQQVVKFPNSRSGGVVDHQAAAPGSSYNQLGTVEIWLAEKYEAGIISTREYQLSITVFGQNTNILRGFAKIRRDDLRLDYVRHLAYL